MLDFFRNHQRLMMALLILIIVPGLGMFGIQGFSNYFDESAYVASVNGHKITRAEFDSAFRLRQQVDRARSMLGAQFDPKMFDSPETRAAMVDSLVQQRALSDEAQRLHLTASDDAVRRALLNDPGIASLRKPDGSIDLERYKQLLTMQGMTPAQYDERMRYSIASEQIPNSIQATSFTSKTFAQNLTELAEQKRSVQGLSLRTADHASKVQPTDAQLNGYYEAHRNDFATPVTATIQYLVLSPATIAAASKPSEDDLKKFYDENIQCYRTEGEVRASPHPDQRAEGHERRRKGQGQAKGQEHPRTVKAHPDQFAQIAEKNSDNPGSAGKGGDVGYFARGRIVGGKAFDDAAFSLKKGEVSNIVESDFGYHIIQATDLKPAKTKPLDQVKDQVAKDYAAQAGTKGFTDDAQGFTDIVYEKSKTLQAAADKYKLTVQTATVGPKPNPQLPQDSPLNNAKFLAAVFAPDSIKEHNNTQAVDVGNNTLISAHVTDYRPSTVPSFDTVQDTVRTKVVAEQAAEMAKKEGEAKLADLQKSKSIDGFTSPVSVSRNDAQGLPPLALAAIFKADATKLPTYVGVDLGANGYAIYRVNEVDKAAPVTPDRLASVQQQISQVYAQADMEAYVNSLKARSKVKPSSAPTASANQ